MAKNECYIGIIYPGNNTEVNLVQEYDLHLIASPAFNVAPIRDYDKQEYAESAEAEIDPRTTQKAFEYKLSLAYWGDAATANAKMQAFYNTLFDIDGDIMSAKKIRLLNHWKLMQMDCYAGKWDGKSYSPQGDQSAIAFDLTFYVSDPKTFLPIS